MFGLPTLPKLLLIAAVIAVIWYFFRRTQAVKRNEGTGTGAGGAQNAPKNAKPIEDMVQCKSCGAYFPANTGCSCGRS